MRFIIYGVGGVGGTIAGRLAIAGHNVLGIARGEHLAHMQKHGLRLHTPELTSTCIFPLVAHPNEIEFEEQDIVLFCMKSQHSLEALRELETAAGADIPVVCVQNGVVNERWASAIFTRVYACVVMLPALYLEPGVVANHARGCAGILDSGAIDGADTDTLNHLLQALESAGFRARAQADIMPWKYAKLLGNLGNTLQAAVNMSGAEQHSQGEEDIQQISRLMKKEALACFDAANIQCIDRAEFNRRRKESGINMAADIAGVERIGGSTLQSIARGTGNIETEFLNGEIVSLGKAHDVATPANTVMCEIAEEMVQQGLNTGHYASHDVLKRIMAAST